MSIKMIRKEFDLKQEEELFDDYQCSLRSLPKQVLDGNQIKDAPNAFQNKFAGIVTHHGRLYLTEDHICFAANIFGVKTKFVSNLINNFQKIHFSNVITISQNKVMGIFDSGILVREKSQEEKNIVNRYQLASFNDRKVAYDRMKALWSTHN